jgi:hypothetical protein
MLRWMGWMGEMIARALHMWPSAQWRPLWRRRWAPREFLRVEAGVPVCEYLGRAGGGAKGGRCDAGVWGLWVGSYGWCRGGGLLFSFRHTLVGVCLGWGSVLAGGEARRIVPSCSSASVACPCSRNVDVRKENVHAHYVHVWMGGCGCVCGWADAVVCVDGGRVG